jgi:hypothetical protein
MFARLWTTPAPQSVMAPRSGAEPSLAFLAAAVTSAARLEVIVVPDANLFHPEYVPRP